MGWQVSKPVGRSPRRHRVSSVRSVEFKRLQADEPSKIILYPESPTDLLFPVRNLNRLRHPNLIVLQLLLAPRTRPLQYDLLAGPRAR
jgi:hypothetical protein